MNLSFLISRHEEGALGGEKAPDLRCSAGCSENSPLEGLCLAAQWLECGALKSRSQVQSPSGSVGFSLSHSRRLKAWAPYSGWMSNKMCVLVSAHNSPTKAEQIYPPPWGPVGKQAVTEPLQEYSAAGVVRGRCWGQPDSGGRRNLSPATYYVALCMLFNLPEPQL